MRVSTSKLQQLAIFTTVLTGGGISTMYYLLQSECTCFIFLHNSFLSYFSITALQLIEHHIWPSSLEAKNPTVNWCRLTGKAVTGKKTPLVCSACPLQLCSEIQLVLWSCSSSLLNYANIVWNPGIVRSFFVPFQTKIRKSMVYCIFMFLFSKPEQQQKGFSVLELKLRIVKRLVCLCDILLWNGRQDRNPNKCWHLCWFPLAEELKRSVQFQV